jgi:hypothetical protein
MQADSSKMGISGRIAALFQSAQITPLLALVAFLLGVFAVMVTPREEEPQINVTMANVLCRFLVLLSPTWSKWWQARPSRCCRKWSGSNM